tara:strand:- start:2288 stop:2695 length:408 start_codon:yes stop_codon:yes gene_type:complete
MWKKMFFWIVLILLFNIDSNAQSFSGTWGYQISGKEITLYGDKISNLNYGGHTGTLKVALYATSFPYSGGTINGYKLYEMRLNSLDAGYSYNDISNTGYCSYPPSGYYYLTILLLEYNYSYEIVDYISLNGYEKF